MNRLILDHFRRWMWPLLLVGALEIRFGWSIAARPQDDFEFWGLLLALWAGANLLSFDLRRGVVRAVSIVPLAARQIGLGWWLATVPIPALAMAALLFSGAETYYYLHPITAFAVAPLSLTPLFNLFWLATIFTCTFPAPTFSGNRTQWARDSFFSMLSAAMLFAGMLFFQDAPKRPFKLVILFGVGAVLLVAGWLRAGRLVGGHVCFRVVGPQQITPQQIAPRGPSYAPGGHGGIPFFVASRSLRTFAIVSSMVALMAVLMIISGDKLSRQLIIVTFAAMASFMPCWFITFYRLVPELQQLRALRSLPMSANCLAAALIAVVILPLMALAALTVGIAGLALGSQAAMPFLKNFAFILAPAALCVFFAVWRGGGVQTYVLMIVTLFGFFMTPLWLRSFFNTPEMSLTVSGFIAAICLLLAFLLTRRVLSHSSHAYRLQATPTCNLPWPVAR